MGTARSEFALPLLNDISGASCGRGVTDVVRVKLSVLGCTNQTKSGDSWLFLAQTKIRQQPKSGTNQNQALTKTKCQRQLAVSCTNQNRGGKWLLILTLTKSRRTKQQHHQNGPYQANRPQVHWRQAPPQAACHQGRSQVRPRHRRRQEAPPLPTRNRRSP